MPRNARAFEVAPDAQDENVAQPGAYYFLRNSAGETIGAVHGCPCGCGGRSALFFDGGDPDPKKHRRREWRVEGEWPAVSLTPSIGVKYDVRGEAPAGGGYHWHGWLRDGVFEEC